MNSSITSSINSSINSECLGVVLAGGLSSRMGQDKAAGPAQEFYHPDYQGRIGLIMPYSKNFCDSCNRL